jgi:hypothetical protein
VTARGVSSPFNIQTQYISGGPVNTTGDTRLNLVSTSPTGRFDIGADGPFDDSITAVTIKRGTSSASFYYKDPAIGSPTITVSDAGGRFTAAKQQVNVTIGPLHHINISPANPSILAGSTQKLKPVVMIGMKIAIGGLVFN